MVPPIFDDWCDFSEDVLDAPAPQKKRLWKFTEKTGGRAIIKDELCRRARSHYDTLQNIADDVARLGYVGAAAVLKGRVPQTKRTRSGELGEILAVELVEEKTDFVVPVRRLRYKDGRESPLRGDDFIGIDNSIPGQLHLLKGESKSRVALSKDAISDARKVLKRDAGRPTPISLTFIADRLIERGGSEKALGQALKDEVANKSLPKLQIKHVLFTLSGNMPAQHLKDDLTVADAGREHRTINIHITDHQDFIKAIYEEIENLGNGTRNTILP
ncbi:MAG: DUF1837 domain-containing protein [Alphaproteobacteria bacterium]|nr:DUF1837 domain-containing protein [Alphaproteobacteria bacterium]